MKESIRNVLDMYREGTLSPEDAERLIDALWDGGEKGTAVPWDNDNKLRVVAYRGRRLVKRGEAGDKLFELKLEGDLQDLECWGSAECGQVFGNASSGVFGNPIKHPPVFRGKFLPDFLINIFFQILLVFCPDSGRIIPAFPCEIPENLECK